MDQPVQGGVKHDNGKVRWDLLPMAPLEQVAAVYTFGTVKYTAWNWRKGLLYSRCFAALMRHLLAWWWAGETQDPESKCHPLAAVVFYCLNFMQYEMDGRQDIDDRPQRVFALEMAQKEKGPSPLKLV